MWELLETSMCCRRAQLCWVLKTVIHLFKQSFKNPTKFGKAGWDDHNWPPVILNRALFQVGLDEWKNTNIQGKSSRVWIEVTSQGEPV